MTPLVNLLEKNRARLAFLIEMIRYGKHDTESWMWIKINVAFANLAKRLLYEMKLCEFFFVVVFYCTQSYLVVYHSL